MGEESDRTSDVSADADRFDPWPAGAAIHVEWGPVGARLAARRGDLVVVVDVLSFSTSVIEVVAGGGSAITRSPEELDAAGGRDVVATELGAVALQKARRTEPGQRSLSPASLRAAPTAERVLMTSLNGGRCVSAAASAPWVGIGALTNRAAIAGRIGELLAAGVAPRCTVVACGETWSGPFMRAAIGATGSDTDLDAQAGRGALRPSFEDQAGVGAIVAALDARWTRSIEATAAASAFVAAEPLDEAIRSSVSGRELVERGFAADVDIAVELDRWTLVPELHRDHPAHTFDVRDVPGTSRT